MMWVVECAECDVGGGVCSGWWSVQNVMWVVECTECDMGGGVYRM